MRCSPKLPIPNSKKNSSLRKVRFCLTFSLLRNDFQQTVIYAVVPHSGINSTQVISVDCFEYISIFSGMTNAGSTVRLAHKSGTFRERMWAIDGVDEQFLFSF